MMPLNPKAVAAGWLVTLTAILTAALVRLVLASMTDQRARVYLEALIFAVVATAIIVVACFITVWAIMILRETTD